MKTTDWYMRLMLSIIAGSLVYLAAALHTAMQDAAAFYARVPPGISAGSAALPAAWRTLIKRPEQDIPSIETEPINVRIVGYRQRSNRAQGGYENDEFGMGHYAAGSAKTVANKLPVCLNCE
ncbi:MAG: hypothetical protein JWP58_2124 [Hymenobacter sp.]|nr:hypothetical protein [Hymenobacter sp.]